MSQVHLASASTPTIVAPAPAVCLPLVCARALITLSAVSSSGVPAAVTALALPLPVRSWHRIVLIRSSVCAYLGGVSTPGECPGPYEVECCTPGFAALLLLQNVYSNIDYGSANPSPPGPAPSSNVGALVTWANDNCASSQGWECAEFSARAIAAGGFIPGLGYDQIILISKISVELTLYAARRIPLTPTPIGAH